MLLAMYTFENDNELKELNERGHVPLPVIRENPVIAWLPMPELPKEVKKAEFIAPAGVYDENEEE